MEASEVNLDILPVIDGEAGDGALDEYSQGLREKLAERNGGETGSVASPIASDLSLTIIAVNDRLTPAIAGVKTEDRLRIGRGVVVT